MNVNKQTILAAVLAVIIIVPKEVFFRFDTFLANWGYNVAGFTVAFLVAYLVFPKEGKKGDEVQQTSPPPPPPIQAPPSRKAEDPEDYMPK